MKLKLLSKTPDAKTQKSLKENWVTFILYLDPRQKNICKWATPGCKAGCLFSAGRGSFSNVMNARERKTKWFLVDPQGFKEQLQEDICQIRRWASKKNIKICIRLNGTSDLDFLDIIRYNADIQFYDYTKSLERYIHVQNDKTLGNYHLTFSRSENNEKEMYEVLQTGGNVAMVFSPTILKACNGYPDKWEGYKVIDGDQTDLRFLDEKNVIIGLKAKGKAKKDPYGFVIKRELPMVTL